MVGLVGWFSFDPSQLHRVLVTLFLCVISPLPRIIPLLFLSSRSRSQGELDHNGLPLSEVPRQMIIPGIH